MAQERKPGSTSESALEREMRDQEVLRANRELAAYFKGRRTEREARAALKIIRAFVRDLERHDPRSRPPLPGADMAKRPKRLRKRESDSGERHQPKPRRKTQGKSIRNPRALINPQVNGEPSELSERDERTPE